MLPRATYRLQLHAGFDFDAAAAAVPYLARLGVSHLYCSPILQAAPGSTLLHAARAIVVASNVQMAHSPLRAADRSKNEKPNRRRGLLRSDALGECLTGSVGAAWP